VEEEVVEEKYVPVTTVTEVQVVVEVEMGGTVATMVEMKEVVGMAVMEATEVGEVEVMVTMEGVVMVVVTEEL